MKGSSGFVSDQQRINVQKPWTIQLTPAICTAFLLTILYTGFYLSNPATPGNQFDPCCITGWVGWNDQGLYYKSTEALAVGNLNPELHWIPLGYAILAAPFTFLGNHTFFPVDLVCLLATYSGFILFARRMGISGGAAAIIFLLTSCAAPLIFTQWVIPWMTTPAAALIWGLLAASASHLQGHRRPFLLGLLAGTLPLMRPVDGIVGAICLAWVGVVDLRASRLRWQDMLQVTAGIALPVLPYAALHLAIYGPHPTQYMLMSRAVGFTAHNFIWRAYVLLLEPRQWFFAGRGMVAQMPWLLLGFAGAVWAWRRGGAAALLSSCLVAYCVLYLCYVDLLPTGLWKYYNINYFKWTLPGFGLLAWLLLRELFSRRRAAWGALIVVLLLSCIRVVPRPAAANEPANVVDMPGPAATEANSTMANQLIVIDSQGALQSLFMMRAFPFPSGGGVRLIGLRRDFVGPVEWMPGHALDMPPGVSPQRRWAEHITVGYPCWLPPYVCKRPATAP